MVEIRNEILKINPKSERKCIYATSLSTGFDIEADEDLLLEPGEIKPVKTGIQALLNQDYELQIRSRSGLSLKGIIVANAPGTIDPDYTGEIKVILANIGKEPFQITKGMRIAQAVLNRIERLNLGKIATAHGRKGFGSTGTDSFAVPA